MAGRHDLNLFEVIKVIHDEEGLTGAAAALNLTQPALSHALQRARQQFQDPLFTKRGRSLTPTPFLVAVLPEIRRALDALKTISVSNLEGVFDLQTIERKVTLGMRDIAQSLFLPDLTAKLLQEAPGITTQTLVIERDHMSRALRSGSVDMIIDALAPVDPDIHHTEILREGFALICRHGHPIESNLTLETYLQHNHTLVALNQQDLNFVPMALAKLNATRHVVMQCESYHAAMAAVSQTDLIMTMPRSFARQFAQAMPLSILPVPFKVPDIPVHLFWHSSTSQDPLRAWIRDQITHTATSL